uniref:Phage head morphogenesis domain-containing protein n=1 Tax=Hot spring virus BHS1 TaxID=2024351 RepID=A0A2Y9CIC5_9VIRU|nr:hypothetical protein [Hot spring virus BHS1]
MPLENRDDWEKRLKRDLLRLIGPQADKLIRLLGNPPDINNVPESFWENLGDAEAEVIQSVLAAIYVESAQQTLLNVPKSLRIDWRVANKPAADWAESYTFHLVSQINKTSRERLRRYVSDFFRIEGTTVADLRGQISELFGPTRAEIIATTEVTRAAAQGDIGIINEIEQANPKIQMVPYWDTSMDELVCPVCGNGLQGVQGWMVGGQPFFRSRDGRTYGAPPDPHPRCRCGLRWEVRSKGRR